jgi:hypothetical protein
MRDERDAVGRQLGIAGHESEDVDGKQETRVILWGRRGGVICMD